MTRLVCFFLAAASFLYADGGALLLSGQSGSLQISVFGTPVPLRSGLADLSVLLQNESDHQVLLDAAVTLRLSQKGRPEITLEPTPTQAASKYMYASQVTFPASGKWNLQVICKQRSQVSELLGTITVLPEQPAVLTYWPYFALIPVAIFLFVLNQYLKRKRVTNRPKRP